MGATHLQAYTGLPNVTVAAVCSSNQVALSGDLSKVGGNLGRRSQTYDFSAVSKYTAWRDLVADPSLDAVDICLPSELHADVAVAALAAGKHVLVEKPMALLTADCQRMLEAAERHHRILMVAHVLRFFPQYRYLKHFVESGEYGSIRNALFVRRCGVPDWSKWLTSEDRSGGPLLDLLIHDLDQALWLFGPPARVAAKSMGEVDTVSATLLYPDGPEVRVQGGWFAAGTPFAMGFQVCADKAELELTPEGLRQNGVTGEQQTVSLEEKDGFDAEAEYFVDCCIAGRQPSVCPPADSAKAVALSYLLKESRAQGGKQIECAL